MVYLDQYSEYGNYAQPQTNLRCWVLKIKNGNFEKQKLTNEQVSQFRHCQFYQSHKQVSSDSVF